MKQVGEDGQAVVGVIDVGVAEVQPDRSELRFVREELLTRHEGDPTRERHSEQRPTVERRAQP
jgi:hypothetical protein